MKKFEVGKEYSVRSIGDHNCVWKYTVVNRTAKTVTLFDGETEKKCRINQQATAFNDSESVFPLGHYSMCPVLHA